MTRATFMAHTIFSQRRLVICILCLLWNPSFVQSTKNSTPLFPSPSESPLVKQRASTDNEEFQDTSANELIPFEEECTAHVTHIISDDGPTAKLFCTLGDMMYLIPSMDVQWIQDRMSMGDLISDETFINFPAGAMLNQYTHEIHMTGPPKLWNHELEERQRRRKLRRLATTGSKTVLVVRVQATDATSTLTAADLGDYVFGDDGSTLNLKAQTEACSYDALKINKATDRTGTSVSISNGIVSISVNVATDVGETTMINTISSELTDQFGVASVQDLADHVMYCFPPGTTDAAVVAFAVLGGYLSFYNDEACSYPSAQIHEIGHNYNMGHSSDSAQEYGDKSGLMGFSYKYTEIPYMCFNAAKSWQLGWYSDKADSITPSSTSATYSTPLAGVVDYDTTSNKVLIEIQQTTTETFYYINYNLATGINVGTQEGANSVLVVSKDTSIDTNVSMSQAILAAGESFAINNFNGNNGETLTITFTSLSNGEANVDIALSGFPTTPTDAPEPSAAPSVVPSGTPSMDPSRVPSQAPSSIPSIGLSQAPSKVPSSSPSTADSASPSRIPSGSPSTSIAPSLSMQPSSKPSGSNQPTNSNAPSAQISQAPSIAPSIAPSGSLVPTSEEAEPSSRPSAAPSTLDEPVNCFEGIDDDPTMFCNCASDCLDDNRAFKCDCADADECCDKYGTPPPAVAPVTPPPTAVGNTPPPTAPPTPPPTHQPVLVTNQPTGNREGECMVSVSTAQCDALMDNKNMQDMQQDQCDCYNFCNGVEIPCCPFGNECSITCSGDLVSGCQAPAPTPPPTQSNTCRLAINTPSCNSVSWIGIQSVPGCDCYNFCNGGYSGCCTAGQPCGMECGGSVVAGCQYSAPNASPTPVTPPPTITTPTADPGPSTFFFWPDGMI